MILKLSLLAFFLGSAAYVHLRGNVKHKLKRQIKDHSTYLAPFNAPIYMFSAVPNTPYQDVAAFPDLAPLKANWQKIRDEGLKLLEGGQVSGENGKNDIGFHSFLRTGWKRFYLKWYDSPLPSAEQLCPETSALLKTIPSIHGAMFALLPPGARLGEHRDPFAGSLRYHLGLRTPNNDSCWIDVDGIRYSWRDGEAVMFDETYIHTAKNESDINRLILFCDVERPVRGAIARAYNHFIINHLIKGSASPNMEGEKIGIINRIFAPLHKVKMTLKRAKRWNKPVYMTCKYIVLGSILALIFLR